MASFTSPLFNVLFNDPIPSSFSKNLNKPNFWINTVYSAQHTNCDMKASHSRSYSLERIFTIISHLEHSIQDLCIDCLMSFDKDEFCAKFNANLLCSLYLRIEDIHLCWGLSNQRQISNDRSLYVLVCPNFLKPTPWRNFQIRFGTR